MKIDRIFHIADVHIRNFKRHGEYKKVIDWTLEYIDENKTENSVIYLAGDIVHSKTDLSPEVVQMTAYFFNQCANTCPTILITGNHDTNLNNNNRLDALTPIVDAISNPNLHYYKDSGVYEFGGIHWAVLSVFDEPKNWPVASEIDGDFKIALHHGAVTSAVTDLNYVVDNETVTPKVFKGYDLALLGDIHKYQYLDNQKNVCYAGSLIQQNHGEGLKHGFVVWDLPEKKSTFVDVPNEIGYYTIFVESGKITNDKKDFSKLPPKLRLRIKHKNTSQSQLMDVISTLKRKYRLLEYVLEKLDSGSDVQGASTVLGNVRDVEYQNDLIVKYLERRPDIDKIDLDGVRHLNRTLNSKLFENDKLIRNVIWKPIDFEFSNMFSYGEGNKVDFTNKKGIQGIFAPNASGKSTLLDSLVFCLFDKSSRTYRGSEIINNRKDNFHCKFRFEMAGDIYTIKRHGTKDKHGNVRVDVDFYKEALDGRKITLNGTDRYKTDKIIRDYIGSYDDFMLTTFSSQNDNKNFIFKSQRERQELLNSFLDNTIFEKLAREAKETLKEHKSNIKFLEKEISEMDIHKLWDDFKVWVAKINSLEDEKKVKQQRVDDLNSKKLNLISNKKTLPEVMSESDINDAEKNAKKRLNEYHDQLSSIRDDIMHYTAEQLGYNELASELDESLYERLQDEISEKSEVYSNLLNEKLKKESTLKHLISLTNQLKDHEYDPNCSYCVNNSFVKSANEAKDKIPMIRQTIGELNENIEKLKIDLDEMQKEFDFQDKCIQADLEIDKLQTSLESLEESEASLKGLIDNTNQELQKLKEKRSRYKKYKRELKHNESIDESILKVDKSIKKIQSEIVDLNEEIISNNVKVNHLSERIQRYEDRVETLKEEESQYDLYEAYVDSVSRNGVPYMLLSKVLPVIQMEVNEILSRIVDFSVEFYTDENKNIHCKINYSDDRHWPVELASGMEKFMISIATRASLVQITSLPRPNFIAIDEGFGVLDSENLASVNLLFENLKNEFKFILCISHIEDMKDLANSLIFINKDEQGYSSVNA